MRSRDRITTTAGLAVLVIGVLAIGGSLRWVVVALGALAAVGAIAQVRSRRHLAGISPLLVVIGAAVGLTALQLIPLPDGLVASLEPTAHELIVDGEALSSPSGPSGWRPLSMDPASTRVEFAKLCVYFLTAWMALRASAKERGRRRLLAGVAGIAGTVALISVAHELLDADKLFGMYAPVHVSPIVMSPLLNANHLGCLMVLGALIAVGLAFHERRAPVVRAMWILIAVLCVGVGVAARSRGAVMGLATGATVMAVIIVLQRLREVSDTQRRDVLRVTIPAAIIVLCTLVLVVYVGGAEVSHDIDATQLAELHDPRSKYAAWDSALALVEEAPVFGVGRGAFESAFTRVHPASSQVTFSHVENEYVQSVVDWGIAGAAVLAGALGFAGWVAARRWRGGALAAAALGGLAAVGAQSLVDFGLELPGIAIPTVIVAATLLHVPLKENAQSRSQLAARLGAIAVAVGATLNAALPWARTLGEDHAALATQGVSLEVARAALDRHPLDYLAAAELARLSASTREQLAYLNLALRLHPRHPGLHRVTARWLVQIGRTNQAALEYRFALAGATDPTHLISEVLATFPSVADAVSALPLEHRRWKEIVTALSESHRDDVALAYMAKMVDAKAVAAGPDMWRRLGGLAHKTGDLVMAERAVIALLQHDPSPVDVVTLAQIQLERHEYDRAAQTLAPLTKTQETGPQHLKARFLLCEIHMARPDLPLARTCLTETLLDPGLTLPMRRRVHERLSRVESALGNHERAAFEKSLAERGETGSIIDGSGGSR